MIIGVLQIELFIPNAASLKDKRQVLKILKDRIRQQFNVSISEVRYQDKWQRSVLAVVTVSAEQKSAAGVIEKVKDCVASMAEAQVMDTAVEYL